MYRLQIQGCLPLFLILLLLLFIGIKLWFVFAIIILFYVVQNIISSVNIQMKLKQKEKETHYEPQKGEVYKVCPTCGISVKRSVDKCPQCGNDLD